MKYLLLMRHAKSSWKNLSLQDFDRPLNKRGKKAAPLMGMRLVNKIIQPQHIISSPAKRAWQTAILVSQELNYQKQQIKTDKRMYHASAQELLKVASQCDDKNESLMLVAHNPGINYLASFLLDDCFPNIPTAGLLTMSLQITQWQQLNKLELNNIVRKTSLLDYDYPKLFPKE
ncbi:MAG: histidine phosphatase family protein [Proteobacteria bacterium]|nr:histidine phosphatase family protein [Pseudomonadota bacterium]